MSDDYNPWENAFEASEKKFANASSTKEAKAKIFSNVMQEIGLPQATNDDEQSHFDPTTSEYRFSRSSNIQKPEISQEKQTVNRKRKSDKPKKTLNKRIPALIGGLAAAALIVVTFFNVRNLNKNVQINVTEYNPPLSQEDFPNAAKTNSVYYKTIATNNHFHLGYEEDIYNSSEINLVVHSRSGEVDWDSFYAIDSDNDLIAPIAIDKENGIVTMPVTDSDVYIEVTDSKGNYLECVLPPIL